MPFRESWNSAVGLCECPSLASRPSGVGKGAGFWSLAWVAGYLYTSCFSVGRAKDGPWALWERRGYCKSAWWHGGRRDLLCQGAGHGDVTYRGQHNDFRLGQAATCSLQLRPRQV